MGVTVFFALYGTVQCVVRRSGSEWVAAGVERNLFCDRNNRTFSDSECLVDDERKQPSVATVSIINQRNISIPRATR